MGSIVGNEDHLFKCDETSGTTLIDSVGSKNNTAIIGTPNPTGQYWELRGDAFQWSNGNSWMKSGDSFSYYIALRAVNDAQTFQPFHYYNPPSESPTLRHASNNYGFDANAQGSGINIDNGVLMSETDIVVTAVSYNRTTRQMHFVVKSSEGLDLSASAVDALPQSVEGGTVVAANNTLAVLTDMDLFRIGLDAGTALSLADLQTTCDDVLVIIDAILNPAPSAGGKIILPAISKIIQPAIGSCWS